MISKIFNWTLGGFFRTIGRTLAFIAIGCLIAWLLSISGFDVKCLFLEKVKADSFTSVWVPSSTWRESGTSSWSNTSNRGDSFHTFSSTISNGAKNYFMKFDSQDSVSGYSELDITIKFIPLKQDTIAIDNSSMTQSCTTQYNTSGSGNTYTGFNCTGSLPSTAQINNIKWGLTLSYFYNNNVDLRVPCYVKSNIGTNYTFTCPLTTNNIDGFVIGVSTNTLNFQFETGFYYLYTLRKDGSQTIIDNQNQNTQEIINATEQQTQQQQQQHQEMMDTNSTNTDNKANSFFNSFDTNETYGGLSSIVTAPLVVVNQMLSNTCVAPSAIWKGATITLPCGDMFWSRPGASDLKNLLNVFYGGFICYYAIRKLFLMIENLKDPTHDKIEVMDL